MTPQQEQKLRDEWILLNHNKFDQVGQIMTDEYRFALGWMADFFISKLKSALEEQAKAYGGCTSCYGKGYSTTRETQTGRNYFQELFPYLPCKECDRGKQIKELIARLGANKEQE